MQNCKWILTLLLLHSIEYEVRADANAIVAVIDFFRLGIRGPLNSTYDSTWQNSYGELTNAGMRQ